MLKVRVREFSTLLFFAIYSAAILFVCAGEAQAQQKPKLEALSYDVVAIRLPRPNSSVGISLQQNGLRGYHVTVKQLMASAYGVKASQIAGGPAWEETERFDVEAKMDDETAAALEKMPNQQRQAARQQMLQAVLAERFQLRVHRGTKEMPIYALVVAKNGLKLKPADPKVNSLLGAYGKDLPWDRFILGGGNPDLIYTGRGIPVSQLVEELNWSADRIVLDKTGLTGNYDVELKWTPQDHQGASMEEAGGSLVPADPGPTLNAALEKQLGLRLNPITAPMDAIVIDHVERPSEN